MASPWPVTYAITLSDPVAVAAYQAAFPNGVQIPPTQAASTYNAPLNGQTPGGAVTPPGVFNYQSIYGFDLSPYLSLSGTFAIPGASAYRWIFLLQVAPTPPTGIAHWVGTRRWINGFEFPSLGDGGSGVGTHCSRDASRTVDGLGYAYRSNASADVRTMVPPSGIQDYDTWERFYIRLRALPVGGEDNIWSMYGSVDGTPAALITVGTGGTLNVYNMGSAGYPGTLGCNSSALALNTWYRVDLHYNQPPAPTYPHTTGFMAVYLNGAYVGTCFGVDTGLGTVQYHANSNIGSDSHAGATHGLECDIDDWICAAGIQNSYTRPPTWLPGLDLNTGSHVQALHPTGFGPAHNAGAWTGDWRSLLTTPPDGISGGLVTTTPSAVAAITTDFTTVQTGCVALAISAYTSAAVTGSGAIGVIGVLNDVVTEANATWVSSLPVYSAPPGNYDSGSTGLTPFTQYTLPNLGTPQLYVTANSGAGSTTLNALVGLAEFMGVFGVEDGGSVATFPPFLGVHNAPYPSTGAQQSLTQPPSQVIVASGVYTGNNIGQDVLVKVPAHWYFVRALYGSNNGVVWWSSLVTGHGQLAQQVTADRVAEFLMQAGVTPMARIAGSNAASNANGVTYQWIAVSDLGMRYLINGAFAHKSTVASSVNALANTSFTPDALFAYIESFTSNTTGMYYKGPGHATNAASPLDATQTANLVAMGTGSISPTASTLHTATPQTGYSAWRRDDGSGTTGWMDIFSYTGDGTGARTITCRLNGQGPLFALVVPHNAGSYYRDPSHTGSTSSLVNGSTSTTAITGGSANAITVGATLNSNAVVYDVFVIGAPPGYGPWVNPTDPPTGNPVPVVVVNILPQPPSPPQPPWPPPPPPGPPPGSGCISLGQAILELSTRLGDPTGIHWTPTEVQAYLIEALHTFNALTQFYRTQGSFTATAAQAFYALQTSLSTIMGYTVTDQQLVTVLEYRLLEPPTPTAWSGTAMFSLTGLTQVLQRKLDRFLWETGLVLTRETASVTPNAAGRVALPLDTITVRRAAWTAGGLATPLLRDDEWNLNAYYTTWRTAVAASAVTPLAYSVSVEAPLTVQLAPPPTATGTLDTVSAVRGPTLNPATGVVLGLPDDYAWVLGWGAVFDVLTGSGPAADPTGAQIAWQLWEQGIAAAKRAGVVLDAQINGQVARVYSLSDADRFQRSWQATSGAPTKVLLAGGNLLALTPVPDANGPYTVTLDVVGNIPIPSALSDCYFYGGAYLTQLLLDYAEFLALFKEGPAQAQQAASTLLQQFLTGCGIVVDVDQASSPMRGANLSQTAQDERALPRQITAVTPTDHTVL